MGNESKEIAARVKVLREIEEVSDESLASELGFDAADYRRWESGTVDFPIGALVEIASRFKVDLNELVSGEAAKLKTFCLYRAGQAPMVSRRPQFAYWNLAHNFHRKRGEPFLVEAASEVASGDAAKDASKDAPLSLNTHPGQEFDYVLEGRLRFSVGGHEMELGPGDSIYYDSQEPHGMKAIGGTKARFLAVIL
jgi:mannose-6-phosphate isomerase-like protein (cupin superfamily)